MNKKMIIAIPSIITMILGANFFSRLVQAQTMGVANKTDTENVSSVEWEKKDAPISINPNIGGGVRIFPEKDDITEANPHNQITVKAKLTKKVAGIKIYFKSFDVDDPSANWRNNDDQVIDSQGKTQTNGFISNSKLDSNDTSTALKGGDNRSGSQQNEVSKEGEFPNSTNIDSAVTDANGEAEMVFTVGAQPGDNFRIAATTSDENLTNLNNDNVPSVIDNENPDPNFPGVKITNLLTVWRTFRIEFDSMRAAIDDENKVSGYITKIRNVNNTQETPQEATIDVDLMKNSHVVAFPLGDDDRSFNLDSQPQGAGRFSDGEIKIGVGPNSVFEGNLFGNGIKYLRSKAGGFKIPFFITKDDIVYSQGRVTNLDTIGIQSVLTVNQSLTDGAFNDNGAGRFSVNVAGHIFDIVSNTSNQILLGGEVKIGFEIKDDDGMPLPYMPKFDEVIPSLSKKFEPAYIVAKSIEINNDQDVKFIRNCSSHLTPMGQDRVGQSSSRKFDFFWITQVMYAFQSQTHGSLINDFRADRDSQSEVAMFAEAVKGVGFVVWMEEERERAELVKDENGNVSGLKFEGPLYAHELAHSFGADDRYQSGKGSQPCPVPGTCGLMESHYEYGGVKQNFIAADLAILRNRRASP